MSAAAPSSAVTRTAAPSQVDDLVIGAQRRRVILEARRLIAAGGHWRDIGTALGIPWQTLRTWSMRVDHIMDANLTAADCAPSTHLCGRKPKVVLAESEVRVLRAKLLQTNRTASSGSIPHAVRESLETLGKTRPDVVAMIHDRLSRGLPPLPRAMARTLHIPQVYVQAHRAPRSAWLNYVSSPGSIHLTVDADGKVREVEPGEWWTIDDATLNFAACVPLQRPGDPCYDRWGVCVGRFQFLAIADHRSYFIPGFSYTARPRGSYRAEDITATLHCAMREHGVPQALVLEHGVSAANLITSTAEALGTQIRRASSPHEKVIEFIFNHLWTLLSTGPGQLGRFRGEEEKMGRLYESCKAGATDPRTVFPTLSVAVEDLRKAVDTHNRHMVQSAEWGSWVPQEWFQKSAHKRLRPMAAADAWMFSPVVTEARKVRGALVTTTVQLMEGLSQRFTFSAEWLLDFHGASVKLFFNPLASECTAAVVLAEPVAGRKAGTFLGTAQQINRHCRYTRQLLGYGSDPDVGLAQVQANAQALNRTVQAIKADGKLGAKDHEMRDGLGNALSITTGEVAAPAAAVRLPSRADTTSTVDPSSPASDPGSWRLRRLLEETAEDDKVSSPSRISTPLSVS